MDLTEYEVKQLGLNAKNRRKMMRNYVLRLSESPRWSEPIKLTLKEELRYVIRGAKGRWDVEKAYININTSSNNTSHARWYWDTDDGSIEIRIGFFDNAENDSFDESQLFFKLYQVRNLLKPGDYGRGNFYYGGLEPSNNIAWKVKEVTPF